MYLTEEGLELQKIREEQVAHDQRSSAHFDKLHDTTQMTLQLSKANFALGMIERFEQLTTEQQDRALNNLAQTHPALFEALKRRTRLG
jgi:hypothetical protein